MDETFDVSVWLKGNSQPIVYASLATYEQGSYTCIAYHGADGQKRVRKFPTASIWAIDCEYKYVGWVPTAQAESEKR